MNMNDGGKAPFMRATTMENGDPQEMTFVDDSGTIRPKGMRTVLKERGLWRDGLKMICTDCR